MGAKSETMLASSSFSEGLAKRFGSASLIRSEDEALLELWARDTWLDSMLCRSRCWRGALLGVLDEVSRLVKDAGVEGSGDDSGR